MELQHRFEVPVGIDRAWHSLLDMEQVAACFPGATLSSADGQEYSGTVKVKLGPIQLTYQGSARIVEADEEQHRAVIEASGNAARSGSTASMTVRATATAIDAERTAVEMNTELTITGRPAQFGRGVMVEVGNKILGRFADCLASKLAAPESPAPAAGGTPAGDAPEQPAGEAPTAGRLSAVSSDDAPTGASPTAGGPAAVDGVDGGHPASYTRSPGPAESPEPIDLLASARGSIVKRIAPLAGLVLAVLLLRRCLRRRRARRAAR